MRTVYLRPFAAVVMLTCIGTFAGDALTTRLVATGFDKPVYATAPPGDTARLFVLEQHSGRIRIVNLADGTLAPNPFLTIANLSLGGEQGLLGMAFHPAFISNGFFFIHYTDAAGSTVIERYTVTGDPNIADPTSRVLILTLAQPEANHNGGWMGFGSDGFLYIALGDGGGANDQHGIIGNAQDRRVLLGKVLRLDVDAATPYAIPDGNPFKGDPTLRGEIWAFGLRNPFRASFDRVSQDLWIGDVGQNAREEIDFNPAGVGGLNFGWRPREGAIQNPAFPAETPVTAATAPVHDYGRDVGVAVIGGYVYRGSAMPELAGTYFFGDFATARVFSLRLVNGVVTSFQERTNQLNPGVAAARPIQNLSSFAEDAAGELYVLDYVDGDLRRIVPAAGAFAVAAMRGSVRLTPPGRDTAAVRGVLPAVPAGFDPAGKTVSVDIGGAAASFTLDAQGRARTPAGTFFLRLRPRPRNPQTGRPEFAGGDAGFQATLRNGTFTDDWTDEGIDLAASVRRQPASFLVSVSIEGVALSTIVNAFYSGKAGKGGRIGR